MSLGFPFLLGGLVRWEWLRELVEGKLGTNVFFRAQAVGLSGTDLLVKARLEADLLEPASKL